MQQILLLATLIAAVSSNLLITSQGNDDLWEEFKNFFQKIYTDEDDSNKRLIWEKTLDDIFKHNLDFDSGSKSFSIGLNQFSDMEDEDFQSIATGLEHKMDCKNKSMVYAPPLHATFPDSVNWNDKGYVTEVQNQHKCGACWAFCGVAALEGQLKRKTGKLVKLSEQHLIDCSTLTGNNKCEGGQMCRAYEYAVLAGGVALESEYPIMDEDGDCHFKTDQIGSKIGGYLEIPYGDEDALLKAVALIGPVAAGLDGMRPAYRHYKSGIYDDPDCSNTTLNHAVTIIGYGTENGTDYWLVKNSWGPHWGENGFAKMVRNKNNQCGLASNAVFPVLSMDVEGHPILDGPRAQ